MWLNTIIENNHSIPQGKWNHNTQVNTKIFCIASKNEQRMPAPPNPQFLSKMPTNKIEKREAQKLGNLKANSLNFTLSTFAKNDQTL